VTDPTPPTFRPTARVLLIDTDRVLMLHVNDPSVTRGVNPLPRSDFWLLPGGGVEPGESHRDAAHREVFEELGLTDITVGPAVGDRRKVVSWGDQHWDVHEIYYAARINGGTVTFDHLTPPEIPIVQDHRWWTRPEIAASDELFVPPNLDDLIAAALASVF
jgi:8-oxo-dGTP pyrophosphatase MutT (NUDIX family)